MLKLRRSRVYTAVYTSQLVKLRGGQHEVAVGIHIQVGLALRNFSVPIAMLTIKPVLSIAADFKQAASACVWWGRGSVSEEQQREALLERERLLSCT